MITLFGGKYNLKNNLKKLKYFISDKIVRTELFSKTVFETVPFKGIYIAGCKKIKDYAGDKIVLECIDCKATVYGESLYIENLVNGQISVMGIIKSLEFER